MDMTFTQEASQPTGLRALRLGRVARRPGRTGDAHAPMPALRAPLASKNGTLAPVVRGHDWARHAPSSGRTPLWIWPFAGSS
jgi:hypothetical protein